MYKFVTVGSLLSKKNIGIPLHNRVVEVGVLGQLLMNNTQLNGTISPASGIYRFYVHRILRKNMCNPFKIKLVQELNEDFEPRI